MTLSQHITYITHLKHVSYNMSVLRSSTLFIETFNTFVRSIRIVPFVTCHRFVPSVRSFVPSVFVRAIGMFVRMPRSDGSRKRPRNWLCSKLLFTLSRAEETSRDQTNALNILHRSFVRDVRSFVLTIHWPSMTYWPPLTTQWPRSLWQHK